MFTIHDGYFHESFPEQAKKAAIYLSENEPFEYFELGGFAFSDLNLGSPSGVMIVLTTL